MAARERQNDRGVMGGFTAGVGGRKGLVCGKGCLLRRRGDGVTCAALNMHPPNSTSGLVEEEK